MNWPNSTSYGVATMLHDIEFGSIAGHCSTTFAPTKPEPPVESTIRTLHIQLTA